MPETTAKARSAKTTPEPQPFRGKRVIVWNPENDFRLADQTPLRGYEMVRNYTFCYVDPVRTEQAKATAMATLAHDRLARLGDNIPYTPVFKTLTLEPGLNWVEAKLWASVAAASTERYTADIESGNKLSVDEIEKLVQSRAIFVFEPGERVNELRQFTGNFEDYSPQELRRLMAQVDDVAALQGYAKDTQDFDLSQIITDRIEALETGY
mgnify:CR=1 FL=1